jgi:hypothetical protein
MWETGDWATTIEGETPSGAHFGPLDEKGFWSVVWVRQGEGDWKVALETWNRLKIYPK